MLLKYKGFVVVVVCFVERVLLSREDGSCLSVGQDGLSSCSKQSLRSVTPLTCLFQPSSLGAAWSRVERAQAREKSPAEVTAPMGPVCSCG